MEGSWRESGLGRALDGLAWRLARRRATAVGCPRAAAVAAVALLAVAAAGCAADGGDAPSTQGSLETAQPLRTFAPLVLVAAGERHRPMSARWFIERSRLGFAEREGCEDRPIAVGRTLPELRSATVDWIFHFGLGKGPAYYRNPYDERCELDLDVRVDADRLTRPFDPGSRAVGLTARQGFVLDLGDEHRAGPPTGAPSGGSDDRAGDNSGGGTGADDGGGTGGDVDAPVYGERTDEGDGGVRLTYWLLFGFNAPPGRPERAHEGDWERIDVLLTDHGDGRYEPVAVEVGPAPLDRRVAVPWESIPRADGSHPIVALARGTHTPLATREGDCPGCAAWPAWTVLAGARAEDWYGFGGAWGEVGDSDATTGPLGPHGHFPPANGVER